MQTETILRLKQQYDELSSRTKAENQKAYEQGIITGSREGYQEALDASAERIDEYKYQNSNLQRKYESLKARNSLLQTRCDEVLNLQAVNLKLKERLDSMITLTYKEGVEDGKKVSEQERRKNYEIAYHAGFIEGQQKPMEERDKLENRIAFLENRHDTWRSLVRSFTNNTRELLKEDA